MEGTSVETDCGEDYEDVPYEDGEGAADIVSEPEKPPAKRSRTTNKTTVMSPHFKLSRPFTDYI